MRNPVDRWRARVTALLIAQAAGQLTATEAAVLFAAACRELYKHTPAKFGGGVFRVDGYGTIPHNRCTAA